MSKKVLIIISTAEKEKALTAIVYAKNAIKNNWLDDIKIVLFGPIEKLLAEDEDLRSKFDSLLKYQKPVACKYVSDQDNVSNSLSEMGYEVEYVGKLISDYIGDGYVPMVY